MFNSVRMQLYILVVALLLSSFSSDAFPEPQNLEFGPQTGNNDVSFGPGERDIIRLYFGSSYRNVNRRDEAGNTALFIAAYNGYEVFARMLIQRGANVNIVNENGNTALHFAAAKGFYRLASDLIRYGANVNASNSYGDSVLHFAASNGFEEIVDLLIQNGANIDAMNEYDDNALHFAANNGHENVVRLLIQKGANSNAVNRSGFTALHLAANNDQANVAKALLESNSDRNLKNHSEKTAKDLAIEKGHRRVIDLFQAISTAQQACDWYQKDQYDRILGGETAQAGEFPWMVALGYLNDQYKITFDCGGTIISKFFVLTAGHCATTSRRPVVVRIGKLSLTDVDDNYNMRARDRQVEQVIQHPNFKASTKKNDIALIRVTKPIEFSKDVQPACLNVDLRDENPNMNLTVTGWGLISPERRDRPNELLKANLSTVPLSECNSTVLEFNQTPNLPAFRNGLDYGQYCAFDPNGVKDSCQGDSGGPLQIYPHGAPIAKVVGVVSFGVSCGSAWPGIYTRVAYYLDWIESHVWPNGINTTTTTNSSNK